MRIGNHVYGYLTERQWRMGGRKIKVGEENNGEWMWNNGFCGQCFEYFHRNQTEAMSPEECAQWRKEENKKSYERRKELEKIKKEEKEREERRRREEEEIQQQMWLHFLDDLDKNKKVIGLFELLTDESPYLRSLRDNDYDNFYWRSMELYYTMSASTVIGTKCELPYGKHTVIGVLVNIPDRTEIEQKTWLYGRIKETRTVI